MDDLLKDAIADAKAVRETAIANAKLALEEAFTPKLQNMLSQKIQNEIEEEMDDEDKKEEGRMDREDDMEEGRDDEKKEEGRMDREEDDMEEGRMDREEDDMEEGHHEEDEMEEGEHEEEMEEGEHEEEMEEGDELDLEAIIKELEAEINEEDEEEMEEGEERDEKDEVKEEDEVNEEDKEEMDENDVSSGIGKSDNAHDKKSGASTDIGKAGKAKHESVDEEFDLDSILEALKEEDEEDEEKNEVAKLRAELGETREAVKFMRDKLNEVNLLNAKLLFTNKLFRAYGLNNEQKMKVVETFDRASNLREVKLVYSTMAETFGAKKTEIKESKGSASKAVASTKSDKQKEVISEGNALRDRFKKLANII